MRQLVDRNRDQERGKLKDEALQESCRIGEEIGCARERDAWASSSSHQVVIIPLRFDDEKPLQAAAHILVVLRLG